MIIYTKLYREKNSLYLLDQLICNNYKKHDIQKLIYFFTKAFTPLYFYGMNNNILLSQQVIESRISSFYPVLS